MKLAELAGKWGVNSMTILHVIPKFSGVGGDTYTASFWVDTDPVVDTADQLEVSTSLTDWLQDMYDLIIPYVSTAFTAVEYGVYIHDILTGSDTPWFQGNWAFTGTNTSEVLPPQSAVTISAGLAGAARPAQKRMIPITEAGQDAGTVNPTPLAAHAALGVVWAAGPLASATYTYTPGVPSRQNGVLQFRDLTGTIFARDTMGTVRSRKPGIGI